MDYKVTLLKALKAMVFVLVGSAVTALASAEMAAPIVEAAGGIPFVGGLVSSLAVAGLTALAVALDNWRKNYFK
jgi:hypothetical protein